MNKNVDDHEQKRKLIIQKLIDINMYQRDVNVVYISPISTNILIHKPATNIMIRNVKHNILYSTFL